MSKTVLLTGAIRTAGTVVTNHRGDRSEYEVRLLDGEEIPDRELLRTEITRHDEISPSLGGVAVVVHIACYP